MESKEYNPAIAGRFGVPTALVLDELVTDAFQFSEFYKSEGYFPNEPTDFSFEQPREVVVQRLSDAEIEAAFELLVAANLLTKRSDAAKPGQQDKPTALFDSAPVREYTITPLAVWYYECAHVAQPPTGGWQSAMPRTAKPLSSMRIRKMDWRPAA